MTEHRSPSSYFEDIPEALDSFLRDNRTSLGDTEHKLYNALLDARREVSRLTGKLDDLVPNWDDDAPVPAEEDGKLCDECEAVIPEIEGGGLANEHHYKTCSLYEEGAK